jgi:hypothetical protein
MHLDEETLERVLHRELGAEQDDAAREHLSGCPACNAALEESRLREHRVFGLLEALDREAPGLDWTVVEASEPRGPRGLLVAASIACVLAAGILYALPGSPLRNWIDALGREAPVGETTVATDGSPSVSGLSIYPTAPFEIVFAGAQASGVVLVDLSDAPEVEIRVLGDPVDLESGPDQVAVANLGSRSSYAIRLPKTGPTIIVRVGESRVLVKSGSGIETAAPRTETGEYRIDLARPAP